MSAQRWLDKIKNLPLQNELRIMNVCGGHERTLSTAGLRSLLPRKIILIPGPGCPVCVCPEASIWFAIRLSEQKNIKLLSFGDMLRVPVNTRAGKNASTTLLDARSKGNDVSAIASPLEVLKLAKQYPDKTLVFFVAGFETTIAPIVALLEQGLPDNVKLLVAARKTWPVVRYLLNSSANNLDALIAPGHVASVMGSQEWGFVTEQFNVPCAVAGFNESSLLAAIYSVCRQTLENNVFLDNCYSSVVNGDGNLRAKKLIEKYFSVYNASWRGIGLIENSGFLLKDKYKHWCAENCFSDLWQEVLAETGQKNNQMPAGCDCDQVVLGKIQPNECRLFGKACLPSQPIGPCMVSDEGACHIWWNTGTYQIQTGRLRPPERGMRLRP